MRFFRQDACGLAHRLLIILSLSLFSACDWIGVVSVGHDRSPPDANSDLASISADGRYVAFFSYATNLVVGDTNQSGDVFVYDSLERTTVRVGLGSNDEQAARGTYFPRISGNGRYVVFHASSADLVDGDTNEIVDVFVRDLQQGVTLRASVNSSGDGGNDHSNWADISHDGRYVVFQSDATNLVADDTNNLRDIFLRDIEAGTTIRVSLGNGGAESRGISSYPRISPDGSRIAFQSERHSLWLGSSHHDELFVFDRHTDTITAVCVDDEGAETNHVCYYPDLSGDGRFVTFWSRADNLVDGDTNDEPDTFVHDLLTRTTTRVSVDNEGSQAQPRTFHTGRSSISADGRYVAFSSSAQLHPDDVFNAWNDIYVHDRDTGSTLLVSANHEWHGNNHSYRPDISADGRYLAFDSWSDNLVPNDTNDQKDIFLKVRPGLAIASAIPNHLPVGATTSITVTGSYFLAGASVWVGDIEATDVVVIDENTITANVTVAAGVAAGSVDIAVFLPGGGPGKGLGAIDICELCVTYQ